MPSKVKQFLAEMRTWVGTPWKHQGRFKGRRGGVDCVGVVAEARKVVGFAPHWRDVKNYGRTPDPQRIRDELGTHLDRVEDLRPGAVLLMSFGKDPQHLAVYTERGTIIHAYAQKRRVVEQRLDSELRTLVRDIYYWREAVD
jgi:cell wall-associated NlpC family hydrolase